MKILQLICGLLLFGHSFVFAQQDFNAFQPLVSQGEIPADFFVRTSEKIEEDMKDPKENLTQREQKVFLDGIHYGVDEILQSGLVIYGDEISLYVKKIANKLLENDPKLRKKLRFYTVKSNVSNAFSTDQGIVFVTTGLISQISTEAHLAYILAHEISHYIEKHVVEGFEFRTRNRGIGQQILQLSQYSKEKEFEADSLGVAIFKKAGYSRKYLTSTFDVLMYSYLPIDELPFPRSYFNSPLCFVPEEKFAQVDFEIKVEEDYDDSKSSHPNIRSRKELANKVADKIKNWGTVDSHFGNELFIYIRNLARFERIRSSIIELQYGEALYTIFILEKKFPESLYLHRMKAQCWLGLSIMKQGNKINQTVIARRDLEGEGAGMHVFIKNLKKLELATLAVRIVEDCRKKFPNDPEIQEISKRTNSALFQTERFEFKDYFDYNFEAAVTKQIQSDTTASNEEDNALEDENLSKYEKIKRKKENKVDGVAQLDSADFRLYLLSDLIVQEKFFTNYSAIKKEMDEQKTEELTYNRMTRSEQRIFLDEHNEQNKIDLTKFILVDPAVISYKKGKVDHNGSEKMEDRVVDGFEYIANKLDLKMTMVGKSNLDQLGTKGFNQKSFFTSMLIQIANAEGEDVFPVDFSRINSIKEETKSTKLIFSVAEHFYRPMFNPSALWLIFTGPGILGYLPIPFIKGNQTELNLIIVDLEKAKIVSGAYYYFKEPLSQYSIETKLYDILSHPYKQTKW